jgi:hypothetical protein
MRNSLALLGIPDLPIYAFRHVGDRKIQPQGGGGGIIDEIISAPANLVSSVSDAAADLDDTVNEVVPGGWTTVVSVAVPAAAPYVQTASILDKGGSIEDAAKAYVIGQVAGQVGGEVAGETGSTTAGNVAGGTTRGLLRGQPLEQSVTGSVTNAAISQVTPSTLFTPSTTTPTQDYVPETNIGQGTTGANNMADNYYDFGSVPDFFNTGESVSGLYGDPNALQNSFYGYGGLGTENPTTGFGSTPMTPAQIDATMQTYGGNSSFDSATQALVKRLLAAGGTAAQGAMNFLQQKGVAQGGLQTAGGLLQMQQSRDAALQAQRNIQQAAGQGVAGAQFRPIGTTTRFGTSNFQVDPATGQLVSAGYTAAPEITSAQNRLMGLGASYLAQTPEEVAQQYMSKQYDLLDPSRQRQLAGIRNQQFQTGRGGLSVGSTGLRPSGAQGLMGANPELEAYYNALAQQDAQLAAQAQQAGQQQVTFGTGLFGQAGQLENMAQQPFALSQGLAGQSSAAGARAGEIGLRGAVYGGALGTSAGATASPLAYGLSGLGNPNSLLGGALGTYLTSPLVNTGGAGGGITSAGMQNPTLDVYGSGYVPLGYANF